MGLVGCEQKLVKGELRHVLSLPACGVDLCNDCLDRFKRQAEEFLQTKEPKAVNR